MSSGLICDGVAASSAIDSSGEILDIDGCNIESFLDGTGTINWEHQGSGDKEGDNPNHTVGRIIFAKKIFKPEDCDTDRQKMYLEKLRGIPYIYIIYRLFDASNHPGAQALAAIIRDCAKNNEPNLVGLSIEGTTLSRDGNTLKSSVARRCAATLKPCNKTSFSQIFSDPTVNKTEIDPRFMKLGGMNELDVNPIVDEDLAKALTAGSYNAAPGALTSGSALQVEDRGLRNQVRAAARDWDRKSSFRKFLKHRMPDASDDFINRFSDMAEDYTIKKAQKEIIKKALIERLSEKLNTKVPDKKVETNYTIIFAKSEELVKDESEFPTVKFNNKDVKVGRARLYDENDTDVALLGHTQDHLIGVPLDRVHNYGPKDLIKLPKSENHDTYKLKAYPEHIEEKPIVDAEKHAVGNFVHHPETKALVHGMDLDAPRRFADSGSLYAKHNSWGKGGNGKRVFIKTDPDEGVEFSTVRKEGLYHNLAKDFYGLGDYVSPTAVIHHPKTGKEMAVIQNIPGLHVEIPQQFEWLENFNKTADAHKLALMNMINDNNDRHIMNFLIGKDNKLKLIDHGNAFNHGHLGNGTILPTYLTKAGSSSPIHPEAVNWALNLNPKELVTQIRNHGAPNKVAIGAANRLKKVQEFLKKVPKAKFKHVLDSPWTEE